MKRHHKHLFWGVIGVYLVINIFYPSLGVGTQSEMLPLAPSPLIINELMADNGDLLADEDGHYSDWIEIYNQSERLINLRHWALTDDVNRPEKWIFPDITLDSGAYLIVFASGKNRRPTMPDRELHTSFRLKQAGEFLGLYDRLAGQMKDQTLDNLSKLQNVSYGRYGQGRVWGYSPYPTPGEPNEVDLVWAGLVAPVSFSASHGFYEVPFTVTLTSSTSEATIRYTTDGSKPTEDNGLVYKEPVWVTRTTTLRASAFKPTFLAAPVRTQTYLFLDEILTQTGMDVELQIRADKAAEVKAALQQIPTISLVMDDDSYYIYAHAWQKGREWERPVSVELIYPEGYTARHGTLLNSDGFQVNAGLRMHGRGGRSLNKISFRLFFRELYGAGKLDYPIFPEAPVHQHETLVLRGGGNRNFTNFRMKAAFLKDSTYARDEWLRASQRAMSEIGAHGLFVHLYLNGHYWGLYNLVERPDAAFMAAYFGGNEADWYARRPDDGTINGNNDRYKALEALVEMGNLNQSDQYVQLQAYLDPVHFSDYMILHWYAGAKDWPHNNWYFSMHNPAGQGRYLAWDGEETWLGQGAVIQLGEKEHNFVADLFRALIQNPDFKMMLADRLYKHLSLSGALSDEQSQQRWLRLNQRIEQPIKAEMARWGVIQPEKAEPEGWLRSPENFLPQIIGATNRWADRSRSDVLVTFEDWLAAQENVLRQMAGNAARTIQLARDAGYYPLLDPPQFNTTKPSVVETELNLMMVSDAQAIYYTLDGSDPRLPVSGFVAPQAILYDGYPIRIQETTSVKARAWADGQWSALNEFISHVEAPTDTVRITEIMYNPPGNKDYEFLELTNIGHTMVDISGAFFEGIDYTFPPNTKIASGEAIVLVANAVAFATRYPNTPIYGVYQGHLANNGERITLKSKYNQPLVSIYYDDEAGWPLSADGTGDSIIVVDANQNLNDPTNWQASTDVLGKPGSFDPTLN